MEDEMLACEFRTKDGRHHIEMYAVWDGHGGRGASEFVKQHMPKLVAKYMRPLTRFSRPLVTEALKLSHSELVSLMRATKERYDEFWDVGTTSCIVLYITTANLLVCANVGDSRSVAYLTTAATGFVEIMPLSVDHKPEDARERSRLESVGAVVERENADSSDGPLRVWGENGTGLSMSRALGDHGGEPGISHMPDVTTVRLRPQQRNIGFVVIGCDGLWDVITPREVLDYLQKRQPPTPKRAAKALVRRAFAKYSNDNISVLVFPVCHERPAPKRRPNENVVEISN